ncbi:MAG: hypothetical protein QM772_06465 [Ottowia sp.]|uniref:lysozyme inhibitor LprI family protein n=1 Tax=Ottowia sp. TaxID=1898956 RepID=UPI0039E580D1
MKPLFSMLAALCFVFPQTSHAQAHTLVVKQCIAENSGASSIDCLEKSFRETQRNIARLEKGILDKLKRKLRANDITKTHYELAVSSLVDASKKFARFGERQCDFSIGASGAVASGSGQVRWSCLIQLNDWRIQYLDAVLSEK